MVRFWHKANLRQAKVRGEPKADLKSWYTVDVYHSENELFSLGINCHHTLK